MEFVARACHAPRVWGPELLAFPDCGQCGGASNAYRTGLLRMKATLAPSTAGAANMTASARYDGLAKQKGRVGSGELQTQCSHDGFQKDASPLHEQLPLRNKHKQYRSHGREEPQPRRRLRSPRDHKRHSRNAWKTREPRSRPGFKSDQSGEAYMEQSGKGRGGLP